MARFEIGQKASFGKTITETDVVSYAGLSGDFNPIHVDRQFAQTTRFEQRIAHGLLTTSLLSGVLGMHLPGPGSVYMGQTLRFVRPVFINDTITATAEVLQYDPEKGNILLKTECRNQNGEIVLEGEAKMRVPREEQGVGA